MQTAAASLGVTVDSAAGGLLVSVAALPGASFVLTAFQAGAVGCLTGRIREIYQLGAGFGLMGTGIALLATARTPFFVFVALLALGMAFIAPNLAALISTRGGQQQSGEALGVQNAANNLGQASGPLFGGALFIWQMNAPYLLSGALLVAVALVIGWKAIVTRRVVRCQK